MRPVLVSIKNTFLEIVDPGQLNCFLVDGHLNTCIFVLWFNDLCVVGGGGYYKITVIGIFKTARALFSKKIHF